VTHKGPGDFTDALTPANLDEYLNDSYVQSTSIIGMPVERIGINNYAADSSS
jgi:hypothetical protein